MDTKKRILVVDDEQDVRSYLEAWLTDEGFEVQTACDGIEASEKCKGFMPDLVTLDIVMPEKTGVRFYRDLKADPATKNVPVIVITGLQQEFKNFISNRKSAPAPDGYIPKPFSRDEVLNTIRSIMAKKAVNG